MLKSILNLKIIFLVLLVGLAYFAWQDPQSIPYPPIATTIQTVKQANPQVLGTSTITLDGATLASKAGELLGTVSSSTQIQETTNQIPEEIVVDDLVSSVTNELAKLPQQEVQKFKVQFCQDVINNATQSASN